MTTITDRPPRRSRWQVDRWTETGMTTRAVTITHPDLTEDQASAVDAWIDRLLAETGLEPIALGGLLVEHMLDVEAYEREAQRRGVLAL